MPTNKKMKIMSKFKMNIGPIIKLGLKISGAFFTIFTFILSFLSFDDLGIKDVWVKVMLLLIIPLFSFLFSAILILFVFKRNRIWKKGKNTVTACYGDLLKYAFDNRFTESRIIVIPVNDTFDTIVEEPGENIKNPLISPKTLHGMWVRKYCSYFKIDPSLLNERIQNSLKKHDFVGTNIKRDRGNGIRYSLGDVAILDGPNQSIFYLLAISSFDEKNNARIGKKELRNCIEDLLEFYDQTGQSIPIYIPLMGTGSSRAGLSHEDSLKIIKSCVLTSQEKINGSVNIVVYNGDKNKVSIFK